MKIKFKSKDKNYRKSGEKIMTLIINNVMQRLFYASKRVNGDGTNRGDDKTVNIKFRIILRNTKNTNKIEYKQKE